MGQLGRREPFKPIVSGGFSLLIPPDLSSYDSSSNSGTQTGTSYSWLHTCAGNNRVLTVAVGFLTNGGSQTVSSITYNGVALTKQSSDYSIASIRLELWHLIDPDVGAHTVSVTLSGAAETVGAAISLKSVRIAVPPQQVGNAVTNSGSPDDALIASGIFSTTAYMKVFYVATDDIAISLAATSTPGTQRANISSSTGSVASGNVQLPTGGPYSSGWTNLSTTASWAAGGLMYQAFAQVITGGLTISPQTLSGSATFSPGTHTASSALTITSETLAASAIFSGGLRTASAALSVTSESLAASATFSAGTHTAIAALSVTSETLVASATYSSGTNTANAALAITSEILAATVLYGFGLKSANGVLTLGSESLAASAAFSAGTHTAVTTLTITSELVAATCTFAGGLHTATASLVTTSEVLAANALYGLGLKVATGALVMHSVTLSGVGELNPWDFWTCDIVFEPATCDIQILHV